VRKTIRFFVVIGLAEGLAAGVLRADEPDPTRSEKGQYSAPDQAGAQKKIVKKNPADKIWEVSGLVGVQVDNNINHLLTNLNVDSNSRLRDTILLTEAMVEAYPTFSLGRRVETDFSYTYDRYDFQSNQSFSYFNHSFSGDLYPALTKTLSLDLGGYADWSGDSTSIFSDDQGGIAGIIWRGPGHLRLRSGYEYRRDSVKIDETKSGHSNSYYASVSRPIVKGHTAYLNYRYRAVSTQGADFSYKMHSVRLGWLAHWWPRFKTNCVLSFQDKPYDNLDGRFLAVRHDKTYSALVKPTVMIFKWLDATASYNYIENHSNVAIKIYSDQIYSFALEGRF
jgi:Surface lipoprotein assembly modifier